MAAARLLPTHMLEEKTAVLDIHDDERIVAAMMAAGVMRIIP